MNLSCLPRYAAVSPGMPLHPPQALVMAPAAIKCDLRLVWNSNVTREVTHG
jgi:hypothetical protein